MTLKKENQPTIEDLDSIQKKEYDIYYSIFDEMLIELKEKKLFGLGNDENIQNYVKIIHSGDRKSIIHNKLMNVIADEKSSDDVLNFLSKYNFQDGDLAELYIHYYIFLFNSHTEIFKNGFLMILKYEGIKRKPLGTLLNYLERQTSNGKLLSSYVELQLRNSFSHEFYWIENGKVYVCENSSLNNPKIYEIADLFLMSIKSNLLYQAYIHNLADKARAGFFKN